MTGIAAKAVADQKALLARILTGVLMRMQPWYVKRAAKTTQKVFDKFNVRPRVNLDTAENLTVISAFDRRMQAQGTNTSV